MCEVTKKSGRVNVDERAGDSVEDLYGKSGPEEKGCPMAAKLPYCST